MLSKVALILILSSVAVSASGFSLGFCSTGMAGSEDKPFITSSLLYSSTDEDMTEQKHIFQDCIERDHGYERSDASCVMYADEDRGAREEKKWVDFWEQKGREIIECEW